ncbi:MAG TPA: OmpA family protein [Thermoanaerobaculia bacterium]|jgi:outer membrane protein OmpA-like peptidoglycan-associated protein|nr:OmpA family protein [Thermoanaerobaculia bacterium]
MTILQRIGSALLVVGLVQGCATSGPVGKGQLVAEVTSEPAGLAVSFRGKPAGKTPFHRPIASLAEVSQFQAVRVEPQTTERRFRILGPDRVEVLIRTGSEPSALAKALGLSRVIVFDYSEATTFEVDHYEIKPTFEALLSRQAELLTSAFSGIEVYVCGHTDSTGQEDHNRVLSLRRAEAVSAFLTEHGVDPKRLRTQGFGADYPVAPNSSAENRALNRRTEIVLPD